MGDGLHRALHQVGRADTTAFKFFKDSTQEFLEGFLSRYEALGEVFTEEVREFMG